MNVIFDLDGTLIDSLPDIHATANTVLATHGFAQLSLDQSRSFIGNGVVVFVQRACAALHIGSDDEASMVEQFLSLYSNAHSLTKPYIGVMDALGELRTAGHDLAVCTNKPLAPTQAVLDHLAMTDRFAAIIGGDSLPVRKPDPTPLLHCQSLMPDGPACFVGDSEVDAETADRAGLPFFLYTEGYRNVAVQDLPHTAAFNDFRLLPDLVSTLSK